MSSTEETYTPTMTDLRVRLEEYALAYSFIPRERTGAEFTRALEAHDKEVAARVLTNAATVIPERMRLDELGLHDINYVAGLPEPSRVMLNGATRFAEHLMKPALP